MPFNGRCRFKVFMRNKPDKIGLKFWMLCDVATNYILNFQVYTGKTGKSPEVGQGKRVLNDLVSHLGKGYGVCADNFFSSVAMVKQLAKEKSMSYIGTMNHQKREVPQIMKKDPKRQVLESIFLFNPDCTLVSYVPRKNKAVILISSEHSLPQISNDEQKKPEIILEYNRRKASVDLADRMIKEYSCRRVTNRYPLAIFMNLLDFSALNGNVLYRMINPEFANQNKCSRRKFIESLGLELIKPLITRRIQLGLNGIHSEIRNRKRIV